MDVNKFNVLLKVIEEGSLTQAAEKLGYTTSGISRLISSLEDETGFILLNRSRNGVVPTKECLMIMPVIKDMVKNAQLYESIKNEINGIETGSVTIGTSYFPSFGIIADTVASFSKYYPNIEVSIIERNSSSLAEMLDNKEMDIAIITKREGNFKWQFLKNDYLVAWVNDSHDAVKDGFYNEERFKEDRFIELYPGEDTDNSHFFKVRGIVPNVRYKTFNVDAAFEMVNASLGVTITNSFFNRDDMKNVVSLPVKPEHMLKIGAARRFDSELSPAAKKFWKYMKESLTALQK